MLFTKLLAWRKGKIDSAIKKELCFLRKVSTDLIDAPVFIQETTSLEMQAIADATKARAVAIEEEFQARLAASEVLRTRAFEINQRTHDGEYDAIRVRNNKAMAAAMAQYKDTHPKVMAAIKRLENA